MPKLYLRNHPTLVARPIIGLEQQLMSNAHWMQDVPKKRSAQLFLDIIRNEVVPYISVAEESKGNFTPTQIAIRKLHNDLSLTLAT